MADNWSQTNPGLESPPEHLASVTPADGADLAQSSRAIVCGVSGTLKVTTVGGETVTLPASVIVAGQIMPLRVKRVFSTGTTATDIWVMY